jgi:hypothetical protein
LLHEGYCDTPLLIPGFRMVREFFDIIGFKLC